MYRCRGCNRVSKPKQRLLVHRVYRNVPVMQNVLGRIIQGQRTEIAREVSVCPECQQDLEGGASLRHLQRLHADNFVPPEPPKPGPREPVTPPSIIPVAPVAAKAPTPEALEF